MFKIGDLKFIKRYAILPTRVLCEDDVRRLKMFQPYLEVYEWIEKKIEIFDSMRVTFTEEKIQQWEKVDLIDYNFYPNYLSHIGPSTKN